MARKTNDLDKSSKNEIDSKKIHTKLETKKIPASVKTIIKTAEKNIKKLEKTSKKVSAQSSKAEKNKVKNTRTKSSTKRTAKTKPVSIIEHYELPYRYNETIVKILYQTPNTLFVYWDISDKDRKKYLEQYGENFFEVTHPILIVHNDTYNYSFEIPINDFANSWYLHVNDSNCEYSVELGRRPKYNNEEFNMPNSYLYVTSSNVMDSPNDHILFDKNLKTVYFRDVKTNIVTAKHITSISFLRNMGKIYSLYDLQGHFNEDVFINSNAWKFDLRNPSSSSTFK